MAQNDRDAEGHGDVRKRMSAIVPALALHSNATRSVADADEEIFLLYTLFAPLADRRGLGQLDSTTDSISITVSLADAEHIPFARSIGDTQKRSKGKAKAREKITDTAPSTSEQDLLCLTLRQDSTSLRTNVGDTGSVAWRSSTFLAAKMLQDLTAEAHDTTNPSRPSSESKSIINWRALLHSSNKTIVELGAGTGVLPCILLSHPHIAACPTRLPLRWIATDQPAIVPLLAKNLATVGRHARANAVDWLAGSATFRSGTTSALRAYDKQLYDDDEDGDANFSAMTDVIVATDCIYNPHLFPAFLDTLSLLATPNVTLALVVCELREADMLRAFLQLWLDHKAHWQIHAIESAEVLGPHLARGSAVWAAWREKR